MQDSIDQLSKLQRTMVLDELNKVINSAVFHDAENMQRLFRYLVLESLAGRGKQLSQTRIAIDVLGKGADFDPMLDSVVRVEVRRLYSCLEEYYRIHGSAPGVRFILSKETYTVLFRFSRKTQEILPGASGQLAVSSGNKRLKPVLFVSTLLVLVTMLIVWRGLPFELDALVGRTVAVLPFTDVSEQGNQGYLANGVSQDIRVRLRNNPGLHVITEESSSRVNRSELDVLEKGRLLDANYLLDGRLQKLEGRLLISVQLLSAEDGRQLWVQDFDRRSSDIFIVEDEIARAVTRALAADADEADFNPGDILQNTEAHELLLAADELMNSAQPGNVRQAIALAEAALSLDPDSGTTWLLLVRAYARGVSVLPQAESNQLLSNRKRLESKPANCCLVTLTGW